MSARHVRCAIQDQGADLLACTGCEFHDRAGALRHAKERDLVQLQLLAQRGQIGGILMHRRDAAGESVTSAIEAYQSKAVAKGGNLRIPHVQVEAPAVHHQQGRS
jgi:hypothetical protein